MNNIIFIGLNLADSYLTRIALGMGAVELNPITSFYGSNILVKGLIALGVVLALYWFRKEKLLWGLNFPLFGVVVWNLAMVLILSLTKNGVLYA